MQNGAIVIPVSALRRIFLMLLVLIALVLAVMVVRTQLFRAGISTLFAPGPVEIVDRNAYQAVFLTNGSTYFGKLQEQGDQWFTLSDVFYLTVTDDNSTQLTKRGSEAQGPKEPMLIPRAQILFIENLRDDSQVVVAIKKYKSGEVPSATAPPATVAPTATARPSASPSPTR